MLRSRVAKLKKQTNSNLLGMVLALLLPQCIQLVVGRPPGLIFFWVGPPGLLMKWGRKLSSLTGPKLWDILGFKLKGKLC